MAAVIKIRRVGNSLGVILSKDVVASLGVSEGDESVRGQVPRRHQAHALRSRFRKGDRVDPRLHAASS